MGDLSQKYNASIQQIVLAWLINHENVIAIPRSSNPEHMKQNAQAAEINLSLKELNMLKKE